MVVDTAVSPVKLFRNRLLKETLAWSVQRSAFYRKRLGGIADSVRGVDDLPNIPVLFRDDVVAHHSEMQCSTGAPARIQYTTGTSGTFLQLYRGSDEAAFISAFYSAQIQSRFQDVAIRPLQLSLTSGFHGDPTPIPGWPFVISAGIYTDGHADQVQRILEREYAIPGVEPRITAITGSEPQLKALTAALLSRGWDLAGSPVKRLVVTGGYLTPRRKALIARLWDAVLVDRFSMSEVFGGAVECGAGGPWIFDVEVIPEVVHPRTLEPVETGVGALVLTGLYPFVQMMPLIRYFTGDLVEIVGTEATGQDQLLVKFVGRQRRSVLDTTGPTVVPLVLAGPLHEILEAYPDIAAANRFLDVNAGSALELTASLRYKLSAPVPERGEPQRIELDLGLRFPSLLFPERTTELTTAIRRELYSRFPALRERVFSGDAVLQIRTLDAESVPPHNAK